MIGRCSCLVFILSCVCVGAWGADPIHPDPDLTPGSIDPAAAFAKLCTHGYTAQIRHVTQAQKNQVLNAYRAKHPDWPPAPYEFDHLVSLEIGGLNDAKNLWPQPIMEARRKDVIETRFHRLLCKGEMKLEDAQKRILRWWEEK